MTDPSVGLGTPAPHGVRRARDVVVEVLRSEGIRYVFGNPGTTELPLVDAVAAAADLRYVLALHEGTVVAMAEGHALASGRPAVCSVHTAPGLGNAMGNLTNTLAHGTPLVVTAGQQDRRHRHLDPLLQADLVTLASGAVKRAVEVTTAAELGTVLRRAFLEAAAPPSGPVLVSIPMDLLDEEHDAAPPPRSTIDRRTVAAAVDELASVIDAYPAERVVVVASDEVAASDAVDVLVRVAERIGARVHGAPLHGRTVFPTTHPLWAGPLPASAPGIRRALESFELAVLLGNRPLLVLPYSPDAVVPPHVELVHLSADAHELARSFPVRLGAVGDLRATLDTLAMRLAARPEAEWSRAARGDHERRAEARYDTRPLHPMAAVHALLRGVPDDVALVDEAITASAYVRGFHRVATARSLLLVPGRRPGVGHASRARRLARPRRTGAVRRGRRRRHVRPAGALDSRREQLPVTFAVLRNRRYGVLDVNLRQLYGEGSHPEVQRALSLDDPAVDYAGLAASLGVPAVTVERADDVGAAVRAAWAGGGPHLLELPVAIA